MGGRLRLVVLGGFGAHVEGRAVPAEAWRHRRGADLVKLLALAPGHLIHREQAIEALWPDLDPEAGGRNLRKAVHFARRALGADDAVEADGPMLVLCPSGSLSVDADAFASAAAEALERGDGEAAARAAAMYAGDLLPEDRYEAWAEGPRERLRRRFVDVLKLARRWQQVIEADPLDEEAYRELMGEAFEAGDRQGAMRAFERLRTVLADEVGVGPDPETVALYEKVLAAEGPETPTPAERARALLAWGLVHWNRKDLEEAERTSEEARALAVDAGLGRELGEASALLGMIAHARGRWRDLFRREFVESVQRSPQLAPFVFDAHLCLAEFSLYGPEGHEAIRAYADELLEVAEEADSVQGMALATLMMGEADLLSGRLEQAQTELASAVDLHEAAHATSGHALSLERLAEVSLSRGRRWQARRILPRSLRLAEASALSSHLVSRVFGTMVVAAADANGSMAAISEAETALAQMEPCEPCSMGFRVNAAVASARAGDLKRAAGHLAEAERIAGMWQGGAWLAGVWEARAALREAQGELEQAAALYREAADLFAQMSRPLDAERCRAAATAST